MLRSFTIALLPGCFWMLLILVDRSDHWCAARPSPALAHVALPPENPITVIDLSQQSSFDRSVRDLAALVRLAPGEDIVAIDDRPVVHSAACSAAPHHCDGVVLPGGRFIAGLQRVAADHGFVDFTVASARASRRVLVLVH